MDESLVNWLASVSKDPFAYVMGAWEWGASGRLANFTGPNYWQEDQLKGIRDRLQSTTNLTEALQPILEATASGHGVGKSAEVSWICKWGIDTLPDTRGVVTANTEPQLKGKTWAELGRWHAASITKDVFKLTATSYYHPEYERTWRLDQVPWSKNNPEAFAGLHNQGRRILLIMDEASAIDDVIWETSEGALTDKDTQIFWLVYGNPTRNSGRFKECFPGGMFSKYWNTRSVDSRSIAFTNKEQISRWIDAYGEDSDFVRIRVYGQFPRVGEMEFFNAAEVSDAMSRDAISGLSDPLALGVDVARYGKNASVIFPRKGRDARTYPRERFQGLSTVQLAEKVFDTNFRLHADGIMVDGGGVGGGVVDQIRHKALFCYEVQFGSKDMTPHRSFGSEQERYANMRSGMYGALRAWTKSGCLPDDPDLKRQFMAIKYTFNKRDEIQLISKEDMLKLDPDLELDDIDALALTFSNALAPHEYAGGDYIRKPQVEHDYDPVERYEDEVRAA